MMYPQPVGPGPGPQNVVGMVAQTPGTPTTPTAMPSTPTGGRKGARAQSTQPIPQVQQKPFPGPTPPGMQYPGGTPQGMYPGMVPAQQGYSTQTGFGAMSGYGQQAPQNMMASQQHFQRVSLDLFQENLHITNIDMICFDPIFG